MKILLLNEKEREKKEKIFGDVAAAGSTRNVRSRRRQLFPLVFPRQSRGGRFAVPSASSFYLTLVRFQEANA
jgi:hypothetical protein